MALFSVPVMIPYRLSADPSAPVHSLVVEAVASGGQAAIATARIILETQVRLIHGVKPIPMLDRCAIDKATAKVSGPYAYVFTTGDRVPHIEFASKLQDTEAQKMDDAFKGLTEPWVHGVLMDCAGMTYISSAGLSAWAGHAKRLKLQLFRIPEPINKVLTIVGLHKHLAVHPDLAGALNGLLHHKHSSNTMQVRRDPNKAAS